jgi:hypothetical protein
MLINCLLLPRLRKLLIPEFSVQLSISEQVEQTAVERGLAVEC